MNVFSLNNINWDYTKYEYWWIGHKFVVNNLSGGFHGLLKQWWDFYSSEFQNPKVLLISENNDVKRVFNDLYKNWDIHTLDLYTNLQSGTSDILSDICSDKLTNKYDIIINQATLEHLYNPFGAVENMCNSLNKGGYLITHTHAQVFGYHSAPRDYIRFMIDWWYDLPQYIKDIELVELYEDDRIIHVFTCYKKIN